MAERKFKYVGPADGEVFAYGSTFPAGEFVAIENKFLAGKAANNPEFEEEGLQTKLDENDRLDDVDLEELSWQKIKERVEDAGGEWTNKEEGITFLKEKDNGNQE